MKVTKIKKQSITQNTKPNNDKYPLKNNKTIAYHKRKNIKQNSSKKLNDKRYSISFIENSISKESKIKPNHSFDNSLELDYLNFSKIDLFKLNQSFEDDIFTPNNKRKKRIVEERYDDTISTMNGNSTIIKNDEIKLEKNINSREKENILNTPSSMCNYYDQSTNKKNKGNFTSEKLNKNLNGDIKKNLSQYYNKSSEKKENSNQNLNKNENNKKEQYVFSINCPNILLNEEKPSTKYLKQNLKSNSIIQKNNSNKNPKISEIDKIIKNKENKIVNSQKKSKLISKINKNDFNINKKYSKSNEKFQYKNSNKSSLKNTKDEIKKIKNGNNDRKSVNSNNKKQKPLNLYYNQNKYDTYFITPRTVNKRKSDKNLSSNKAKGMIINTGQINKNKSFVTNKTNKNNIIKNNLIYMNNKEGSNPDDTNYKMIKELINDFAINTNKLNKTTPKNKTKIKKEVNSSKKDFIKVNLKNSTKSSSNFASTQKNFFIKNQNPILFHYKQNNNNPNSKMKSEIKNSFNIYKNIGKNDIYSPINKNPSSINFEAQKTLTEQNVFTHKIQQATPKNYKVQKFDSVPFTAIVKKIFVGSSKKDNFIKFDSSMKKRKNPKTKTEQMKCIFKPKTQSDLKNYDKMFGLGGDYGNDKHVKQKLLDRMNKATNNWQYIFSGNKNKKIVDDGISNLKNNFKDKDRNYLDYFNKEENIISDGSEKEDEN